MTTPTHYFVFDVESVGLHGEGFAVAGGIYSAPTGAVAYEFELSCPLEEADGSDSDRDWVKANVPVMQPTHRTPRLVREAFWGQWMGAKALYPGINMVGECLWPVEAGFVALCVLQPLDDSRKREGPYPFHEIASIMLAAGMDPMATYERKESEKPAHHPLHDSRLSARLLFEALAVLENKGGGK